MRCVDWHPTKALLATGSRDNLVKLWDPKGGKSVSTLCVGLGGRAGQRRPGTVVTVGRLHGHDGGRRGHRHIHKNAVLDARWNRNGNWLGTCSRDSQVVVYDIRMMRELEILRGHKKEVTGTWRGCAEALRRFPKGRSVAIDYTRGAFETATTPGVAACAHVMQRWHGIPSTKACWRVEAPRGPSSCGTSGTVVPSVPAGIL